MAAVSWLPLTNAVVSAEPFQTTTALLLKWPPFTVIVNTAPPAVALLGDSEVTDGVAGHPPQETTESNKIADAANSPDIFNVATNLNLPRTCGRRDSRRRNFEKTISVAHCSSARLTRLYSGWCVVFCGSLETGMLFLARNGLLENWRIPPLLVLVLRPHIKCWYRIW